MDEDTVGEIGEPVPYGHHDDSTLMSIISMPLLQESQACSPLRGLRWVKSRVEYSTNQRKINARNQSYLDTNRLI